MKKLIFLIGISLYLPVFGLAATFWVTNTNDSGEGSLRQAITSANSAFGPDNVFFNIPETDANYNSDIGVWLLQIDSDLPYLSGAYTTIDATTQASSQSDTNPLGPEIIIDGAAQFDHCFKLVSAGNSIKGFAIGGFESAILVYGNMATDCVIEENFLGVNAQGNQAFENQYGVCVSGDAANILIKNNLISGNSVAGVILASGNNVSITGNLIGVDATGMIKIPNPTGVMVYNSASNIIGGNAIEERNVISGNTDNGVFIHESLSKDNLIINNYVGVNLLCNDTLPNGNGVLISEASMNFVGGVLGENGNVISGNTAAAVVINGTGANENHVYGNFIGTNQTGESPIPNHYGVIIKADAEKNYIGGSQVDKRNIISANREIGVYIEAADSNIVSGNYIGTNVYGTEAFYDGDTLIQANGVEMNTLAKYNVIGGETPQERNIISGNRVYGAIYYGNVSRNKIIGNYIGTDLTGNYSIPNATGICVDDASNANSIENNLLSGNISYGIFIVTSGSYYNYMYGNLVGTNAEGNAPLPNDVGLLIAGGAKYNFIGGLDENQRNVFSGNRYGGIELVDYFTSKNKIIGNYIGTDVTGMVALPNEMGIVLSSNSYTNIIESNVISANNSSGIIISDCADTTCVYDNLIGLASDGVSDLGNKGSGILICGGSFCRIGNEDQPNVIAFNDSVGVLILDDQSQKNKISGNSFFQNGYLGIDIAPYGINVNDPGDVDFGPNHLLNHPIILSAVYSQESNQCLVEGVWDGEDCDLGRIELYLSGEDPFMGVGEGAQYLGFATCEHDGNWSVLLDGVNVGDNITALAICQCRNTSEFSGNMQIVLSVEEFADENSVLVFPNPNHGILNFKVQNVNYDGYEVFVTDMLGNLMFNSCFNQLTKLDLSFLDSGLYMISVLTNEKIVLNQKIEIIK